MRGWENVKVPPEHLLKMMSPKDRADFGKGGLLREEAIAKAEDMAEKEIQKTVITLLEAHRGIVVIYSRMDRKATTPPGTPDLIFSVKGRTDGGSQNVTQVFACAWECKTLTGEQSKEQKEMQRRMETPPNAFRYRIIRSADDARAELKAMGL